MRGCIERHTVMVQSVDRYIASSVHVSFHYFRTHENMETFISVVLMDRESLCICHSTVVRVCDRCFFSVDNMNSFMANVNNTIKGAM